MDVALRLVVKTPNQRIRDLQVNCDSDWTVHRLKEHLSDVYPTKPESQSQKLIYSGRLLQDSLKLSDVFDKKSEAHTVHIVCASNEDSQLPIEKSTEESTSVTASTSETSNTSSIQSGMANDGLRYRGAAYLSGQFGTQGFMSPEYASSPSLAMYMQQMMQYHMHNMTQNWSSSHQASQMGNMQEWQAAMSAYQAYMSSTGYGAMQYPNIYAVQQLSQFYPGFGSNFSYPTTPVSSLPGSPVSSEPPLPPETPYVSRAAEQASAGQRQEQVQPPAGQNPRPQGVRMNAGGAMFDDEEEEEDGLQNRDWLDWIHTFLRAGVLFSIMYFYSTVSRFLLVCILGLIVYLYQAGHFYPRRNQDAQANENGNEQEDDAEHREEAAESRVHSDPDVDENQEPQVDQSTRDQIVPPRPGVLTVLYSFVTTFFTSLIPQGPPPIQQP